MNVIPNLLDSRREVSPQTRQPPWNARRYRLRTMLPPSIPGQAIAGGQVLKESVRRWRCRASPCARGVVRVLDLLVPSRTVWSRGLWSRKGGRHTSRRCNLGREASARKDFEIIDSMRGCGADPPIDHQAARGEVLETLGASVPCKNHFTSHGARHWSHHRIPHCIEPPHFRITLARRTVSLLNTSPVVGLTRSRTRESWLFFSTAGQRL